MDEKLTLISKVEELSRQIRQYRTANKKLDRENKRLKSLLEIENNKKQKFSKIEEKLTNYEIQLAEKDKLINDLLELNHQQISHKKLKEIDKKNNNQVKIKLINHSPIGKKDFGKKDKKDLIKEKMDKDYKVIIPPEDDITDFSCNICMDEIKITDIHWLENCDHKFCKSCMMGYITFGIDNSQLDFTCPINECKLPIDFSQIKDILMNDNKSKNYIEKYDKLLLDRTLQKMDDIVYCPNEKCSLPCPRNGTEDMVTCERCKEKFCFKCHQQWHKGFTCDSYQKWKKQFKDYDGSFMNWIKASTAKQCPGCNFWVQRTDGCNHMTCRCGTEFCYICGGEYGRCSCEGDDYYDSDIDYNSDVSY